MTQEAISLYIKKLAAGGMLVFHISNRSLKLDAVLADLAERIGATCLSLADRGNSVTLLLSFDEDHIACFDCADEGDFTPVV